MAETDPVPTPPPPAIAPLASPPIKVQQQPMAARIAELDESQAELLAKLRGLKQDVQNWRVKLDTEVKTYKEELSELKKGLNTDIDQLNSEFKELRATLRKQQDDVTVGLKNLAIHETSEQTEEPKSQKVEEKAEAVAPSPDKEIRS